MDLRKQKFKIDKRNLPSILAILFTRHFSLLRPPTFISAKASHRHRIRSSHTNSQKLFDQLNQTTLESCLAGLCIIHLDSPSRLTSRMRLILAPDATIQSLVPVAPSAKSDASNATRQNQLAGSASTMAGNVVSRPQPCRLLQVSFDNDNETRTVIETPPTHPTHPSMDNSNKSGRSYGALPRCARSLNCRSRKPLCEH